MSDQRLKSPDRREPANQKPPQNVQLLSRRIEQTQNPEKTLRLLFAFFKDNIQDGDDAG